MQVQLDQASARHPAARPGSAPALAGVSLSVAAGEQVAVIGPSGAGKTTLVQALATALPLAGGTLHLNGDDPWAQSRGALKRLRGRLFLAPQVPPLPPRQRVVTAVLAGTLPALGAWASLRTLIYPHDIPGAHAALAAFGVEGKLFDRVDRLSGGERQRVALARALVAPATLWLVDEPLSALDPTRAEQVLSALRARAAARGATLVATLHQVDLALAHFPRVVGLRGGALAFDLPSAEVTPQHLAALYAQHEAELQDPAPLPSSQPARSPAPVAMHCR